MGNSRTVTCITAICPTMIGTAKPATSRAMCRAYSLAHIYAVLMCFHTYAYTRAHTYAVLMKCPRRCHAVLRQLYRDGVSDRGFVVT